MGLNTYECMFLLDTNRVSGDVPSAAKQIHTILEKNHSEVLASRPWDERRLAYPIKGHKKGLFYLTYFRTEGKNLVHIERDVALNEMILRSLVLKVDPKLVDTMLALARDENALALQVSSEESAEGGGGGGAAGEAAAATGEEAGRGPRRGRKHAEESEKE